MTLANCKRLFEHFVKVGNKVAAEEMRKRIEFKVGKVEQSKPKK